MAAPVGNTCPDIDTIQADLKQQQSDLNYIIKEIDKTQYTDYETLMPDIVKYMENVISALQVYTSSIRWGTETNPLELLRNSNSALRDWGANSEEEISAMDDKISTLEAEIESFEYQLQESKDLNERLQNEVSEADEQLRLKDSEINELKAHLLIYVK